MDNAEIYYFTGSGNSLYVAKKLQEMLPGSELIPMVSLLHRDTIETKAGTVGFVFPIHGMTVPVPVKKFFTKLNASSAEYFFAIATRAGTWHNAFTIIDKRLSKSGKKLGSSFSLNMASNDPKFKDWKPASGEDLAKIETEVNSQLNMIQKVICARAISRKTTDYGVIYSVGMVMKGLSLSGMYLMERTHANNYFYADKNCAGCGTCEAICPSLKIKIADKKPVWQDNVTCYFCYACVNYCPRKAVQIKSKVYMRSFTESNDRYPHPYAAASDIARQKIVR